MQKGSCILCFAVHIFFDIDSTIFSARFELTSEREHIITDGWLYKRVKKLDFFLSFLNYFCALFQLLVCKHSGHVSFNFLFCFFFFFFLLVYLALCCSVVFPLQSFHDWFTQDFSLCVFYCSRSSRLALLSQTTSA